MNTTPYQFPITSHTNVTNIQPTPGYPANAAQTIIYVSSGFLSYCMHMNESTTILVNTSFLNSHKLCKRFLLQTLPHNFYPPNGGLLQPAWYSPNGFPGFNPNVMPDNPIHFAPSQTYPKPQGRGNGSGGGSGGSSGYNKQHHRGRGRGGGMNNDRGQQGDNRGTPDMRAYQAAHSQQSNAVTGTSNSYNSNIYSSGGAAAVKTTSNYMAGNYSNHYRGRDSRSSWDGGSNSSKKSGTNYNHHSNPIPVNSVASYPQSVSISSVPSNTNVSSSGTGFVSPQYYTTGQTSNYVNNGAKPDTATSNTSQPPAQSGPAPAIISNNTAGAPGSHASPSPPASGQVSVQTENVSTSGGNIIPSASAAVGVVHQKTTSSNSSGANNNHANVNMQSLSTNISANQSPSKLAASSMLPIQTVSVSVSAGNTSQPTPVVVSTAPQPVASQQSSSNPAGSNSGGSQRPTRGASDDSNNGAGYHGHNTGYYQNYHPKSSSELNKDAPPM
jgi:hypothetical protein